MNVACTVACKFPSPQLRPLNGHSFWLKTFSCGCLRLKRRCVVLPRRQMKQRGGCEWIDQNVNKQLKCLLVKQTGTGESDGQKGKGVRKANAARVRCYARSKTSVCRPFCMSFFVLVSCTNNIPCRISKKYRRFQANTQKRTGDLFRRFLNAGFRCITCTPCTF